ncbi:hypothetical protein E3E12_01570 [Formicincola oecophyllae]|uniref:Uncharacterized protein n=1 Tax=Formicincola oecophyllae TaxID=2558361 RepID=A0A4Y6U9R6_9PROT|nr:hypothetical protein [Formicincola oecophyllae]QDH13101.1 hypothetical protein E3E12_01570 [Formicincola oecophyllae]
MTLSGCGPKGPTEKEVRRAMLMMVQNQNHQSRALNGQHISAADLRQAEDDFLHGRLTKLNRDQLTLRKCRTDPELRGVFLCKVRFTSPTTGSQPTRLKLKMEKTTHGWNIVSINGKTL